MLICQITDLHVRPRGLPAYRVSDTNMLVERAIDAIVALRPRPDVVLITGDLTDCGLPEEYDLLRSLIDRLDIPTFMVPGNHDRRETLKQAFYDRPTVVLDADFVQFVVDDFPIRLIGLDTLVPGRSEGALCERRLSFLEGALAQGGNQPTVIFMHHPPFPCGMAAMDGIRLIEGADRLAGIVASYPNVERILCGHHHRPIHVRFAGTIASVAAGVSHQVALDLADAGEGMLVFEPPAFELHLWCQGFGLVSHMAYVERFPGPFPFVLDPAYPGQS